MLDSVIPIAAQDTLESDQYVGVTALLDILSVEELFALLIHLLAVLQ